MRHIDTSKLSYLIRLILWCGCASDSVSETPGWWFRVCFFHWTWVCSMISCLVTWFHNGLESCTISLWGEDQTDYVQWWFCTWILDWVLQPVCRPSVLLIMLNWECFWEQFPRATFLPTHLHRLTFRDPRQAFVKAHAINIRGGTDVPASSLFSAWLQQIWKENTLWGLSSPDKSSLFTELEILLLEYYILGV